MNALELFLFILFWCQTELQGNQRDIYDEAFWENSRQQNAFKLFRKNHHLWCLSEFSVHLLVFSRVILKLPSEDLRKVAKWHSLCLLSNSVARSWDPNLVLLFLHFRQYVERKIFTWKQFERLHSRTSLGWQIAKQLSGLNPFFIKRQ